MDPNQPERTSDERIANENGHPVARLAPAEQPETDDEFLAHARRLLGSVDDVDWELEDDWEANQ